MKNLFFLYIFVLLIYIFSVQTYGLIDPDEPRYASTSKNMVLSGDYIVPRFNGKLRINKPPLTYWLIAGCYKIFSINEFTSRLPHIICSFLLILSALFLLSNFLSVGESFLFAAVSASSPLFFYLGRYCNTDMILTFFFSFALIFFYKYFETRKNFYLILFYISYLLTNLAKGPVAYIIILILIIFLLIKKEKNILTDYKFWLVILLLSLTPLFYLVLVAWKTNGDFKVINIITRETTGRFIKGYRHPEPFYFYFEYFPVLFFPWAFFFITKIFELKELWRKNDFNKMAIIWLFIIIFFFSISKSKLLSYILPLSFPFAYLTAQMIKDLELRLRVFYLIIPLIIIILSLSLFLVFKDYAFPDIKILLIYFALLFAGVLYMNYKKDLLTGIAIFNLLVFLSIFVLGADFINNNKSEIMLKTLPKGYKIINYRSKLTGIAFYYGNYTVIDNLKKIIATCNESSKKILIVCYKSDFKRIKDKIKYKKIAATKRIIVVEPLVTVRP